MTEVARFERSGRARQSTATEQLPTTRSPQTPPTPLALSTGHNPKSDPEGHPRHAASHHRRTRRSSRHTRQQPRRPGLRRRRSASPRRSTLDRVRTPHESRPTAERGALRQRRGSDLSRQQRSPRRPASVSGTSRQPTWGPLALCVEATYPTGQPPPSTTPFDSPHNHHT
jgi:hypothetical protein